MTDIAAIITLVLLTHRGSACKFCAAPDCPWDGDYAPNPDGSNSQRPGAMERHQADVIETRLRAAGYLLEER